MTDVRELTDYFDLFTEPESALLKMPQGLFGLPAFEGEEISLRLASVEAKTPQVFLACGCCFKSCAFLLRLCTIVLLRLIMLES